MPEIVKPAGERPKRFTRRLAGQIGAIRSDVILVGIIDVGGDKVQAQRRSRLEACLEVDTLGVLIADRHFVCGEVAIAIRHQIQGLQVRIQVVVHGRVQ